MIFKTKRAAFFIFVFIYSISAFSYEKADAFIVRIYDEKVKVVSPIKYKKNLSVIIHNETLINLTGKIVNEYGEDLNFVALKASQSKSIVLRNILEEKIYFVPLTPPFQKVELKLGNRPYEIPPQE